MKINKIAFPYPVCGLSDDYLHPIECEIYGPVDDEENGFYVFDIMVKSNNAKIDDLISRGKAAYVCDVECSKTFYEKNIILYEPNVHLKIPKNSLREKVTVTYTITALDDINGYSNADFNEDYNESSFDLKKGDLLAVIAGFDYNVDIKYNAIDKLGSFMTIEKGPQDSYIEYDLDGPRIRILIPAEMFENYRTNVLSNNQYNNIMHASVVHGALTYALTRAKEMEDQCLWAQTLLYKIQCDEELQGYHLFVDDEEENINYEELDIIAQIILKDPFKRLFDSLKRLNQPEEDE